MQGARAYSTVAAAAVVLTLGNNLPTPLYELYRQRFDLSPAALTLVYATYSTALVPLLLFFGPLGDAVGRRRSLLLASGASLAAMLALSFAQNVGWLVAGRLLQAIATAGVSGNAVAALVELQPRRDVRQAGVVAAVAMSGGVALGPMLAGLAGEYLPHPLQVPYLIEATLVGAILIAICTLPFESARTVGKFRIASPGVPSGIRLQFATAALTAGIGWAAAGLYLGLAPSYVVALSHVSNIAVGGFVVSLMLLSGGIAQLVFRRKSALSLEIGGLLSGVAGLALLVIAYPIGSLPLLLAAAVLTGIGSGAPFLGALHIINRLAPAQKRGSLVSCYFAVAYLCTGLPVLGIGIVAGRIGLFGAVRGFALIVSTIAVMDVAWLIAGAGRNRARGLEQIETAPEIVLG